MTPTLPSLPEDILLAICTYIQVTDLLSLKQTCRALHVLGSSDYLWHQLVARVELPLDMPPNVKPTELCADELQSVVIRAFKLEQNWSNPVTSIKRLTGPLYGREAVEQMHLLPGAKWLITLSRKGSIVLWSLHNTLNTFHVKLLHLPGSWKFSAVLNDGNILTIAILAREGISETLNVYSLFLDERLCSGHVTYALPSLKCSVIKPDIGRHFHNIDMYDNIVAATTWHPDFPPHILFANTVTGVEILIKPHLPTPVPSHNLGLKLFSRHFALTGDSPYIYSIHIYDLPQPLLRSIYRPVISKYVQPSLEAQLEIEDLAPVSVRSYGFPLGTYDFFMSGDQCEDGFSTSSIVFGGPNASDEWTETSVLKASVDCSHPGPPRISSIVMIPVGPATPFGTSHEQVRLGLTGRRAVWLHHDWTEATITLKKFSSSLASKYKLSTLLSSHMVLPFNLQSCQCLAFDEATGRLSLSLANGDLHILDFL